MIPKQIHFCWLSDDPYPPKIKKCIESWKEKLPEYEIVLWDTNRFDLDTVPWVKQAFDSKKYAFAADYIRFYALYYHGGIYLDSDVEVLRSFDELLDLPYFVGLEQSGTIEAAVMGAEKHCDWIKYCLDYYQDRNFILSENRSDIRKLPEIMNEVINRHKKIVQISESKTIDPKQQYVDDSLCVFPDYVFSPKIFDSRQVILHPETFTIHHYQNSWFSNKAWFYYRLRSYVIRLCGYNTVRKIEKIIFRR